MTLPGEDTPAEGPVSSAAVYPPSLTATERTHITRVAEDFAMAQGLAVRPAPKLVPPEMDPRGILATHAPFTLFPSPFPRECFEQARSVQKAYNELYANISNDEAFLENIVEQVADGDDFVASLWNVHQRVKKEGYVQTLSLGLFRSDYMVHQDRDPSSGATVRQVKQVEFNTIASSFGGLSAKVSQLHRHLATTEYPVLKDAIPNNTLALPPNQSAAGLAAGIREAFNTYGASELGHPVCVLFVVQDGERNIFDQRHLEYELSGATAGATAAAPIPVFRIPFSALLSQTSVADSSRRQLLYRPPQNPTRLFEVAVAYLRAGYGPGDYPDEKAWDARYQLERSAAIKCPTVLTQLAGTKKVQQVLTAPKPEGDTSSVLGRFIPDGSPDAANLRRTFTNIYPMDASPAGLTARNIALDESACQAYVLKPQREGGGNNIYRSAIPGYLRSLPETHWPSHILMELITPPALANVILRDGNLEEGGVICELGVYGTCLWQRSTGEVLYNEDAGYLLRTKGDQSEEGGVAAGYGCMDSICLVD